MRVLLVAEAWEREIEVDALDDTIEAEGMTWEREALHHGDSVVAGDSTVPRFVPAVSG
ncbi:MAG: hypothetical protein K0R60_1213 [Microbacterium sp.]|nr:hypothetical protein [Microbacterium sp.]